MAATADSLATAVQYHQAGDLPAAERIYRAILAAEPQHADALHLLGLVALQVGQPRQASDLIRRALGARPNAAVFHSNLGIALMKQGKAREAIASYRRAVSLKPDYAEAYNNLAVAWQDQGQLDEAVNACRHALLHHPNYAEAFYNLAVSQHRLGDLDEAISSCQRALQLRPDYTDAQHLLAAALGQQGKLDQAIAQIQRVVELKPDSASAHDQLAIWLREQGKLDEALASCKRAIELQPEFAKAHNTAGTVLQRQGRLEEAVLAYQRALESEPAFPEALNNLGVVLQRQGRFEEAVQCYQRVLRNAPDSSEAHNNLGFALQAHGQLDEAVRCYHRALQCNPDSSEAQNNLGSALQLQGRFDEAILCYQRALRGDPDYAKAHQNLGFALLASADFENGWNEYEWRWQAKDVARDFSEPIWDGSPLKGRTILVYAEQGFGDTIQFARYLPLVKQQGGRVLFECPSSLHRLLASLAGVDCLVTTEDAPEFDVRIPLLSLPRIFKTRLETIPADIPYLAPEPSLVEDWKGRLGAGRGHRLGIIWQGNPEFAYDRFRSIPLQCLTPIAEVPDVRFFSLQKGYGAEQLATWDNPLPVIDLGPQLHDFVDTAAVLLNLDLLVTSDTAVAHLAGAMGVPVWLATQFAPDWRWMRDRADSPWYPTMRLFRQSRFGDWHGVFNRMATSLRQGEFVLRKTRPPSLSQSRVSSFHLLNFTRD